MNPEYDGVRHILRSPLLVRRTAAHIGRDDFDWDALAREAETMSGGQDLLVRIARELWQAEKTTGLWELPRRLDDGAFAHVLRGLTIYRGGAALPAEALALPDRRAA